MRRSCLLLLLASMVLRAAPQAGLGGTISGSVTRSLTGEPVGSVRVLLWHRHARQSVTTDQLGNFAFGGVPAGDVEVGLAGEGLRAGQARPFSRTEQTGGARFLTLAAGQHIAELNLILTTGGSIAGRIVTPNGDPAVGTTVEIARAAYEFGGRCTLETIMSSRTDDRGLYRFFNVEAGEYYIRAANIPDPESRRESRAFFPGTMEVSKAQTIAVLEDQETGHIDFAISKTLVTQISGNFELENSVGADAAFRVEARKVDGCDPGTYSIFRAGSDGFTGVVATIGGAFEIVASAAPTSSDPNPLLAVLQTRGNLSREKTHSGRTRVELGGAAVQGVTIKLRPLGQLTGQVRSVAGSEPIPVAALRAIVSYRDAASGAFVDETYSDVTFNSSGAFATPMRSDGKPYFVIENLPGDAYVVDVRSQDKTVYDDLDTDVATLGPIEVFLDSRGGSVEGKVLDSRGNGAPAVLTILLPEGRRANPLLYRTATTDRNGVFRINGVAPGNYKILACDRIPRYAWHNSDFLKPLETLATAVQVQVAGSVNTVAVRLPSNSCLGRK